MRCRPRSLCPPYQLFLFDNICFFLTILNEFDKTSLVISKSRSPFSTYSVILHRFKILLHPSFWILGFDNDRYHLLTLLLLFEILRTPPLLNMLMYDSLLSFKNGVTVMTLFSRFTLLYMRNREHVTTPSTSTNY